jgi:hypothetical protein
MDATLKITKTAPISSNQHGQLNTDILAYVHQKTDEMTNPVVIIISLVLSLIILSLLWTPFVLMIFFIAAAWGMIFMLIYMAIWPIILDIFKPGSFEE